MVFEESFSAKVDWYTSRRAIKAKSINHKPEYLPSSITEAYEIQREVINRLSKKVGGWKIGGSNWTTQKLFDCKEIYFGPIFNENISSATVPVGLSSLGELKGEVEVIFRLSDAVESIDSIECCTIEQLVDGVAAGIEFPYSVFSDIPDAGLKLLIADLCGSGGLSYGDFVHINKINWDESQILLVKEGQMEFIGGSSQELIASPIQIVKDFICLAKRYGIKLEKGQLIATGGCSPCVYIKRGYEFSVDFGSFGSFEFAT